MNNIEEYNETTFDSIKHRDKYGNEFWYARELQKILDYTEWRNFDKVINKAIISAENSTKMKNDWVVEVNKPIKTGKGKKEIIKDYKLSRYICYLIVQNADPNKEIIALAQTYFAVQTRRQEISEMDYSLLSEDEKRFYNRDLIKKGNYSLNKTAKKAGVKNMGEFHNAGYRGLYNGETANDIAKRKGLRYREDILDNMGSSELIANLFRIDQTEQKMINDKVKGESNAKKTHYQVGKKIRKTIKELGGTMPEDLPTPNKSLKELKKHNSRLKIESK